MSGDLAMGGNAITNVKPGTRPNDVATLGQLQDVTTGPTGPAESTYLTMAALMAAPVTNRVYNFAPQFGSENGVPAGPFRYETGAAPYSADGANIIKLDAVALSVGALVRQSGKSLAFRQRGARYTRSAEAKALEIISMADDGFLGDGLESPAAIARNNAALVDVKTRFDTITEAGNRIKMICLPGRYAFTEMPNLAAPYLEWEFQGEPWLINKGTGGGLTFDGGATGPGIAGMRITGFPRVFGGPNSQHGIYMRAIHRSRLEARIKGAGAGFSGLYAEWCVSNELWPIVNFNEGGYPESTPARGMTLTSRGGDPNFQCSYNNIYDPEFSGLPIGLVLDGALGNKLFGGAIQGNALGCQTTSFAWANKFFGTDFEVNTVDLQDNGLSTQFYGTDMEVGPVLQANSREFAMYGGEISRITVDATAVMPLLSGTTINRFSSGGIFGAGQDRLRLRDIKNRGTGEMGNVPRMRVPLTVGPSPYTYTNTTANTQAVTVYGGVLTSLTLTRFIEEPAPLSGQYTLGPGDKITVTYTGTDAPGMSVWSL